MVNIFKKYWFKKFFYAFRGLFSSIREEKSMVVHLILSFIVIAISIGLKISINSWIPIIMSIGFVISTELINTSLENIVDMVSFEYNINVQKIKDTAAAATLIVAISALAVSLFVFVPRILEIINVGY